MKKIKVNYKSVFKYDTHKESVNIKGEGTYKEDDKKKHWIFYDHDNKMEIIVKGQDVTLINGQSILNLSYHRNVHNLYQSDYGQIELYGELVTLEHDEHLKLKYNLSDGLQPISEVYVLLKNESQE